MTEKIKVYIDRSRWLRGEGPEDSRLLRSTDGKMCCLGFCLLELGKTEDEIRDVPAPLETKRILQGKPEDFVECPGIGTRLLTKQGTLYIYPTGVAGAMEVNDAADLDEPTREAHLSELMVQVGIELVFGDGPEVQP